MEGKPDLRATSRARRAGLGPASRRAASDALAEALEPLLATARAVASYVPVGDEPGIAPRPGWLLPVLLPDGDLDWAAYDGTLVPGPHGLREPVGPRLGVEALATCDVVLVPALAVDRQGRRLGRGGGSYDRALPRARGLVVALLHDGELVDRVPAEEHDVPVDAVTSPSTGLLRLPGQWRA